MKKLVLVILMVALSSVAKANYLLCIGKIDQFMTGKSGGVTVISQDIYGDGLGRDVCNIASQWKGVSSETCKIWASQLLAAFSSQTDARIVYTSSAYTSCSTQASWDAAESPHTVGNFRQ